MKKIVLVGFILFSLFLVGCNNENVFLNKTDRFDTITSEGYLNKMKDIYNKVNLDMTKEEVIGVIGKPNDDRSDSYVEILSYSLTINNYEHTLIEITIDKESNKVYSVESYLINVGETVHGYNFSLAEALNTDIDNIIEIKDKIIEGMTLEEVKEILGNSCFQSAKIKGDLLPDRRLF